jgi:hypothetical protein
LTKIEELLKSQELKLIDVLNKDNKKGTSIKQTISLIKFALQNKEVLEKIKNNLIIEDEETIKEKFFIKLHLSSTQYTDTQMDSIYHEFYGWLIVSSKARWKNSGEARFTKKVFNDKYYQVFNNSSIVNAVFRTKEFLGIIDDSEILKRRKDLFVKQIEDINRNKNAKERIIKNAIYDFIYSDIELAYIIDKGEYTEPDFLEFLEQCFKSWESCFDQNVIKEIDEYTNEEKNSIAIKIYDTIMNDIEIKFKNNFGFNTANKYVRNGAFLKLSDKPKIGWHPEWETKYNA